MSEMIEKTLRHLRNTRELRAEILDIAATLAVNKKQSAHLIVAAPVVSEFAIRQEWERLMPAITPGVGSRMHLAIEHHADNQVAKAGLVTPNVIALERPNYRFEVLRLLLGASLEGGGPKPESGIAAQIQGTQLGLVNALGASVTPVRSALIALRDAGLIRNLRWLEIAAEDLSIEQLSRLRALPQVLRFRFERGARIKSPAELLQRVQPLLGPKGPDRWEQFSLSGMPVALRDAPTLDLIGTPRLDLVAHVPRSERTFDAEVMRLLDDGLELEPNPLAPAPVVVTLVRAGARFDREDGIGKARCAHACDVYLSLLDIGLRDQALQYAKVVRS
jgi:hypothetical protein